MISLMLFKFSFRQKLYLLKLHKVTYIYKTRLIFKNRVFQKLKGSVEKVNILEFF